MVINGIHDSILYILYNTIIIGIINGIHQATRSSWEMFQFLSFIVGCATHSIFMISRCYVSHYPYFHRKPVHHDFHGSADASGRAQKEVLLSAGYLGQSDASAKDLRPKSKVLFRLKGYTCKHQTGVPYIYYHKLSMTIINCCILKYIIVLLKYIIVYYSILQYITVY